MKLSYRLVKLESCLAFQALKVSDSFTSKPDAAYESKSGVTVISSTVESGIGRTQTAPIKYTLFLQPIIADGQVPPVEVFYCNDNKERDEVYDKVKASLRDWATNWFVNVTEDGVETL